MREDRTPSTIQKPSDQRNRITRPTLCGSKFVGTSSFGFVVIPERDCFLLGAVCINPYYKYLSLQSTSLATEGIIPVTSSAIDSNQALRIHSCCCGRTPDIFLASNPGRPHTRFSWLNSKGGVDVDVTWSRYKTRWLCALRNSAHLDLGSVKFSSQVRTVKQAKKFGPRRYPRGTELLLLDAFV